MAKQQTQTRLRTKQQKEEAFDLDLEGQASNQVVEDESNVVALEPKQFVRNMSGMKKIFTDLFKLSIATVIKYEGFDESNEHPDSHAQNFTRWKHEHPFRTYDKKGRKMDMCTPIGGHFHLVEWEESTGPDKAPVIKSVSGPMVMQKVKVRGKMVQQPVPANDYDDHTHGVEYLRSAEIQFSTTNIQAASVIASEAKKTAPLAGVVVK